MIHTVLGGVGADQLGPTSMHEHLYLDLQICFHLGTEEAPLESKVTLANRGYLHWNALGIRDNLVVDDPAVVSDELKGVAEHGGWGVVDLTVAGIGRKTSELPALSEATGVHVMVGCGFYIHEAHPPWIKEAGVDDVTEYLLDELENGIEGTAVRPALIGEIGTSSPVTGREMLVLRAAGAAGAESGAAINVHLDSRGQHAPEILDALVEEGMEPARVIFSHMDGRLDIGHHKEVAQAGAIVEYDTFGSEDYFGGFREKHPTDQERMEHVAMMVSDGYESQLTFGCDVYSKAMQRRFGGMGMEHLFKRILPTLQSRYGISDDVIHQIVVQTPRQLLDR